ncbi:hypothetical protein ACFSJY_00175 [Thalassotalea euphylliae]|uniref:hypothetical protein n=1 Tax=Thalassotalea euphylliae TaxID=1655234 RepID=UPI0036362173
MSRLAFLLLFTTACFHCFAHDTALREPPKGTHGQYIKALLTEAYKRLGLEIEWLTVNGARELKMASNDTLSGALARAPVIESDYPELIRVDYPILRFSLLKVSDTSRCDECTNDSIKSVALVSGSVISKNYLSAFNTSTDKSFVTSPNQLNLLLTKQRVDSVLIMDFQLADELAANKALKIEVVDEELDYHYLAPHNAEMKMPLVETLKEMKKEGVIDALANKFAISQ